MSCNIFRTPFFLDTLYVYTVKPVLKGYSHEMTPSDQGVFSQNGPTFPTLMNLPCKDIF